MRQRHPFRTRRVLTLVGVAVVSMAIAFPAGVWATDAFTDVPSSGVHHDAITAIADAGVTKGCTSDGSQYCPSDFVTRAEMASFMDRLGSLSGQPPSVNADTVDGMDGDDLTSVAYSESLASNVAMTTDRTENTILEVTGLPAGTYQVTASLHATAMSGAATRVVCDTTLGAVEGTSISTVADDDTDADQQSLSQTFVVTITSSDTATLQCENQGLSTGSVTIHDANLVALRVGAEGLP